MISLDGFQAHVLARSVDRFRESLQRDIGEVVRAELRGFEPAELRETLEELHIVTHQLAARPQATQRATSDPWPACTVHGHPGLAPGPSFPGARLEAKLDRGSSPG